MTHFMLMEEATYAVLLVCITLSLIIAAVVLGLSYVLAIQSPDPEKTSAYECGFEPFEDARNRFDVRFYIVAILFLIFDIEVAFLFPWAGSLSLIGSVGYFVIVAFFFLLTIGFLYEVVKGALNPQ